MFEKGKSTFLSRLQDKGLGINKFGFNQQNQVAMVKPIIKWVKSIMNRKHMGFRINQAPNGRWELPEVKLEAEM